MAQTPPSSGPDPSLTELLTARPHLTYSEAGLCQEGIPLAPIAAHAGTPCWVYGAATLRNRFRTLRQAMDTVQTRTGQPVNIHYAVKANSHLAVLRLLAGEGAGADVVSGGELLRAREAGIQARHVAFSGVGKSPDELRLALRQGIGQINVESAAELDMIAAAAAETGAMARVAVRVNPDVDAHTHAKITTGLEENKFGVPMRDAAALYAQAARLPGVQPVGLATHIGSQISQLQPYRDAFARLAGLVRDLRTQGHTVQSVDCGGGLGISYRTETEADPMGFADILASEMAGLDVTLAIEPGRWLVGPAGVLVASVVLNKQTGERRFMVLDAAMNDLMRPAMYEAWHGILPLNHTDAPISPVDVVGPVCETGDSFATARELPDLEAESLVALLDAGAYGAVMSSCYNTRPLAAEVMVDGASQRWSIIRPRQPVEALWRDEEIPDWLNATPHSDAA